MSIAPDRKRHSFGSIIHNRFFSICNYALTVDQRFKKRVSKF